MTAPLPIPGDSEGVWGTMLNTRLTEDDVRITALEEGGSVGPQGPQGPTGPQGATGPQGPAGSGGTTAVDPRINATNLLTGGFGIAGDGTTNDTTAFSAAVTAALATSANLWNGYHVLYIPQGTYLLNNPTFTSISNLYLIGDGMHKSLIKQHPSYNGFMSFDSCSYLRMRFLGHDANNVSMFGGTRINGTDHANIKHCRWFNSNPRGPTDENDRFGLIFRYEDAQSSGLVSHNLFEDLQAEFDHIKEMIIEHNVSLRSPTTMGMGSFGVGNGCKITDVIYRFNKIYNAHRAGLVVQKDATEYVNTEFKRIQVYGNEIVFEHSTPYAIKVGVAGVGGSQTTDVFEDIDVSGNKITYMPTCPPQFSESAVIVWEAPNSGFAFERCICSSNIIENNGRGGYFTIAARRFHNGRIESNTIRNAYGNGIALTKNCQNTIVKYNSIEASQVLSLADSDGGNVMDATNMYIGEPDTLFFQSNVHGTDTLANPTNQNVAVTGGFSEARWLKTMPTATASIPAGAAAQDGRLMIETVDSSNARIVAYKDGARYRTARMERDLIGPVTVNNDGEYNAFPGFTVMPSGKFVTVYRSGSTHLAEDGIIKQQTSVDGGLTWSSPTTIYNVANHHAWDTEITLLSNGTLLCEFSEDVGGAALIKVYVMVGTIDGSDNISWGSPILACDDFTEWTLAAGRPFQLFNGDILIPVYGKNTAEAHEYAAVIKSTDNGATWGGLVTLAGTGNGATRYNEANGVQLASGRVVIIVRNETLSGYSEVHSDDNGTTWTNPINVIDLGSGDPQTGKTYSNATF